MNYVVDHIPLDTPYGRRPGLPMVAHSITIHTTRRKESTSQGERAWLTCPSNTRQKSYHIVVDEHEAIECLPHGEVAWHTNDGVTGLGNRARSPSCYARAATTTGRLRTGRSSSRSC